MARTRGPGHLRPAGAASAAQVCLARVAHLARWRRQRRRPRRRLQPGALGRGGFAAGPRSHFVFLCKSHESGFPRAGAVMPAAAGRARAPLCSAERAAVFSRGGAAPESPPQHAHTYTPRPDPPAAPRLPGLGALESAEFAEREPFKFSALGSLERGLRARKEDGGERWEGGGAAGSGAPMAPTRSARYRELGGRDVCCQKPSPGPCLPSPSWSWCLFCGESERPLFLFSALGGGGGDREIRCGPCVFFKLKLDRARRGLVIISRMEHFHGPRRDLTPRRPQRPGLRRQ